MSTAIPTHADVVAAVSAYAPAELLPALARASNAQLSRGDSPALPRPWSIASLARECIAYSGPSQTGRITGAGLVRLGQLDLNQADPILTDVTPAAADSLAVRYLYQQVPFGAFQPLAELARLVAVCDHADADYAALDLEVIREQTWVDLLGMPLRTFVRAAFVVFSLARQANGVFDPAQLADPDLTRFGVTAEQALHVFHNMLAAELPALQQRCAADRASDPAMRRLDFNPLASTPFVGLGGGRYVAPSMHLVEKRISLTAIYHLGVAKYRTKFARDLGKLTEAYVGRQLDQLSHDALVPEQPYGSRKNRGKTCDWVLSMGGIATIVECKSARVPLYGQRDFDSHLAAVGRDVGASLAGQVPVTAELIRSGDAVFSGFDLPTDVCAIVVTADPFLMVNSEFYRSQLPDPGCPHAVLSLGEVEWFVATVLAGADAGSLIRELTNTQVRVESVLAAASRRSGVDHPVNPLLMATFDQMLTIGPAA
ncbi:hypothetical protein [Catellatospora sp. NPDC049133]|uniref:hypothetical protein n=1 Tax=Catellatospora sp. NPDC049133 TaxID=3155499 RepID=UPI0033C42ECA